MMWDAGRGGAGPYVHCSCGKDHSLPGDLSDDEYDAAESFEYIELDGQLFVYECEGCEKKLLKYENFIWDNRNHFREYLKIRINQEKAWADQEKMLNALAGI
jgi:hypothetical protein